MKARKLAIFAIIPAIIKLIVSNLFSQLRLTKINITIIVPFYNEQYIIDSVFKKIQFCSDSYKDISFILVENGSTDNTRDRFDKLELQNKSENIKFHRIDHNRGYGYGIKSAFRYINSPYFGWTHGDNQTDIFDIIRFRSLLLRRISSRPSSEIKYCLKGVRYARPISDSIISSFMSIIASFLYFPMVLKEINAQPSIYHVDLLKHISNPPDDYNIDAFMLIQAKRLGFIPCRLPVLFPKRDFGISSWNIGFFAKVKFIFNQLYFLIKNRFYI